MTWPGSRLNVGQQLGRTRTAWYIVVGVTTQAGDARSDVVAGGEHEIASLQTPLPRRRRQVFKPPMAGY